MEDNVACHFTGHLPYDKIKSIFTPWKFESIKKSKYPFCAWSVGSDWYFQFQLIAILKPDVNYLSSFTLFWVDKVITET